MHDAIYCTISVHRLVVSLSISILAKDFSNVTLALFKIIIRESKNYSDNALMASCQPCFYSLIDMVHCPHVREAGYLGSRSHQCLTTEAWVCPSGLPGDYKIS